MPLRTFDADRVLDLVAEHGLTFLIGAPTNLAMLAAAQEARPRDLSSLRGIVTMGAPLEREAALRYQQVLNPRIFNGYGSTEGFWNTFLRPTDLPNMPAPRVGPAPTTTCAWSTSTRTDSPTTTTSSPRTTKRSEK